MVWEVGGFRLQLCSLLRIKGLKAYFLDSYPLGHGDNAQGMLL